MFIVNICLSLFVYTCPEKPQWGVANYYILYIHISAEKDFTDDTGWPTVVVNETRQILNFHVLFPRLFP